MAAGNTKETADRCTNACEPSRPRTVGEELDAAIEHHNREIVRLITLRDMTPGYLLAMPQEHLAKLAYPTNPF